MVRGNYCVATNACHVTEILACAAALPIGHYRTVPSRKTEVACHRSRLEKATSFSGLCCSLFALRVEQSCGVAVLYTAVLSNPQTAVCKYINHQKGTAVNPKTTKNHHHLLSKTGPYYPLDCQLQTSTRYSTYSPMHIHGFSVTSSSPGNSDRPRTTCTLGATHVSRLRAASHIHAS